MTILAKYMEQDDLYKELDNGGVKQTMRAV